MTLRPASLFRVAGLLLVAAGAARAEDFTLTVPYNLTALDPRVTTFKIACAVLRPSTAPPGLAGSSIGALEDRVIGRGEYVGTIVRRSPEERPSLRGSARLAFNAVPGRLREQANSYDCALFLGGPGGVFASPDPRPGPFTIGPPGGGPPTPPEWAAPEPGAILAARVGGAFPPEIVAAPLGVPVPGKK